MNITREYNHRTFGAVGAVVFETPKGKYVLNGTELPESSVAHLMTFALQTLQDAYAGAKDEADAVGAFNTKLDRLLNGTIGTRSGGGGVSEETSVARSIVRQAVKAKFGAKSEQWATFTGLSDDDQNAKLDAWFAEHEATFRPAVDAKLAERRADRERRAGLAGSVSFDI
jgi:hypothetical protein